MLVCRHCGWENPDEAAFCTNCGRGLVRGRAIRADEPPATAGGRFRALGAPVVTVQASEPPPVADPPLPSLRAPASTGSAPTLLDFRMPEQMLAELARMRGSRSTIPQPKVEPDTSAAPAEPDLDGPPTADDGPATADELPSVIVEAAPPFEASAEAPPVVLDTPIVDEPADPPAEDAAAPALHKAASRGLGDIARALRAEAKPADADDDGEARGGASGDAAVSAQAVRPAISVAMLDAMKTADFDPPTLDPGVVEPVDEDEDDDVAELLGLGDGPAIVARPTVTDDIEPPPGVFTDPPTTELPFFESVGEDLLSMPPDEILSVDDEEADLPFVLGPELEVAPPQDGLPPGDSVDLLPPDGSVDFESEDLERPSATQEDVPAVSPAADPFEADSDGFTGLIEAEPDEIPPAASSIEDYEALIEDVEEDALLDSGDMEAIVVTQTQQRALRAAPPPMPAAVSARFVLRPLSENLDESFVVAVGDEPIDIGRLSGDLCFGGDRYLSPLHARFEMVDDVLKVTDLDSLNGIWLRVRDEARLEPGAMFLVGQQVIRLEAITPSREANSSDGTIRIGAAALRSGLRLAVIDADGEVVARHHLPADGSRIGRQLGDIVFTRDSFMSGTHALVQADGDHAILRDLDSRNGTWLRLTDPRALAIGDAVMLGRTVLRVGQPSG